MPRKQSRPAKGNPSRITSPTQFLPAESPDDQVPESGDEPTPPPTGLPFPVVGVGASAGGLEAASQLLRSLPADTGMAFVMVHHLSPSRESMLSDILGRATAMPVRTVESGMPVEPNHVYVIPPGSNLELSDGTLQLLPRTKTDGTYRPIDQFLRSLALVQGHKAIGVILSGTSNDGTPGCEEIKAEGGITFAQDESAQQDSMPKSATAAGCVDFVLPPEEIAREIARIGQHPLVGPGSDGQPPPLRQDHLSGILEQLHAATGVDFSHYKQSTLTRRITRRMVLHRIDRTRDYERMVAKTPGEVEALAQDILISVTSFFRDPNGFELLKQKVFPDFAKDRSRQVPIRIWVVGCSTGEEAYSVAIAFSEYASAVGKAIPAQIFASDLSAAGIETARAGWYAKSIERDVSPDRLRRFFLETDGGYRVTKAVRDMVVFARHNALSDPPFSHVDLATCRNLLIYLDTSLQRRLIPILHYSLNPKGYLWLGASETVGPFRTLFELLDPKHKLYQRTPARAEVPDFGRPEPPAPVEQPERRPDPKARGAIVAGVDPQREADRLLLSRYAPAGVLVDSDFEILQFRGDAGAYLTPSAGRASLNLLKMLREGLLIGVRGALLKAKRDGRPVRHDSLRVKTSTGYLRVSVEVIPITSGNRERFYMVVFDDQVAARARAQPAQPAREAKTPSGMRTESEIARLRQELADTREHLQSVIEQQEAANEELQSANEEVQSTNEELQSINEELETSKEEIQSSSEELATVNDELSTRNHELTQSNNDLTNLIASVEIPIVMLGPDLRIRRFTPSAERLLKLRSGDVGRPISDIKLNIEVPRLEEVLAEVMETATTREYLAQDRNGTWYSLRLWPYRTKENRIDGVVLLLVDVDSLKRAEEAVRAGAERLIILQDQAPLGIRELDHDGRYTRVNAAYCDITGHSRDELLGRHFLEILVPEDRSREESLWQRVLAGEISSYREEFRCLPKTGEPVWVEIHGFALRDPGGKPVSGVAFIEEITERKEAEAQLRAADHSKNEFLAMLAHEIRNPLAPLLHAAQLLGAPNAPPERVASLRGILERQIRNLSRMTDDLLDVSRISRGQMQLHPEVVELGTIVQRAAELFRPTIEGRDQTLAVELPDQPIYLEADPVRLEQVVDNLLSNASKFTESGGRIRLTVSAPASTGSGMVEIRVRDTGRGITPEVLPTIFEPFTQAEQSLDRAQGGLGIGLTLVRSIVELHHGTVQARSEGPGAGAEFLVRLPLPDRPLGPVERGQSPIPRRGRKVLIVDDNADAAETLAVLLRRSGHEVAVADDGGAAVQVAEAFRPQVVLLDIGLPGKDGLEVARELRSRPGAQPITLIAVSGYGQEEIRARATAAGIDHYFTKPVDLETLLRFFATLP